MFFHSICQCIRFQYVSRIKMYSGLTKTSTALARLSSKRTIL
ncbi:branched-chain amino acid permease [Neisseria meningitidis]|nr:branched-chain amino acid permease [Neisseria meningitidis]